MLLILACSQEPVVPVVSPPEKAVAEAAAKREREHARTNPDAPDVAYAKAEGVYIDVRYFGGRSYPVVRAEVEEQFGPLLEQRPLPEGQGVEYRLERGTLRVKNDRIYMIDVPLPEALRRSPALRALGFPDQVSNEWDALSGEFRIYNVYGFRRLMFYRAAPGTEDISRVQAWRSTD